MFQYIILFIINIKKLIENISLIVYSFNFLKPKIVVFYINY